jgi:3-methyladenine DNA glycosylase AlkD
MDEPEQRRTSTDGVNPAAAAVQQALRQHADQTRALAVARFFKTGPGEYGEGDRFIGVTVPVQRTIARRFRDLPLDDADSLLQSPVHEDRLTALLILVEQFTRSRDPRQCARIFRLYMTRLRFINNWDLVDTSAAPIVGGWLAGRPGLAQQVRQNQLGGEDLLGRLARSKDVWSRRIAMIATLHFTVRGDPGEAIRIATLLIDDEHDLIRKAVGWMLREVGKRASADALRQFLAQHAATMPRTTLRYAIERMPPAERKRWMRAHLA